MRATKENVAKIKEKVRKDAKKVGEAAAIKRAIGAVTAYAGSDMERTFTESQLHEIFGAVMER